MPIDFNHSGAMPIETARNEARWSSQHGTFLTHSMAKDPMNAVDKGTTPSQLVSAFFKVKLKVKLVNKMHYFLYYHYL